MRYAHPTAWLTLPVVAGLVFLFASGQVRAEENLRKELAALAKQIKELLDKEKQDAVAVGEFTGPAHLPGTGTGIRQVLGQELTKLGVTVKADAKNFEVKGSYRDFIDPTADDGQGNKFMGVKISTQVYDAGGEVIANFKVPARLVHGESALFTIMSPAAADVSPAGDAYARNKELQDRIRDHKAFQPLVAGNSVAASAASPYAVEIRVKSGKKYVPRTPELKDGLAFVSLKRDETYAVVLHNHSAQDAAVQVTIDGLSMFAFGEKKGKNGQPLYSHLIIDKGQTSVIEGWYVTSEKTDEFLITDYAKSAAAELKSKGEVGTITVTFAAAWEAGKKPADEPVGRTSDVATGRGARIDKKYEEAPRETGNVRAAISVRYRK